MQKEKRFLQYFSSFLLKFSNFFKIILKGMTESFNSFSRYFNGIILLSLYRRLTKVWSAVLKYKINALFNNFSISIARKPKSACGLANYFLVNEDQN